jgi:hypothetical protein
MEDRVMRRHTTFTRLTLSRLDSRHLPSAVISHQVATPIFDTTAEPAAYEMRTADRNELRIALSKTEAKLGSKPTIAAAEFTLPEGPVGPICIMPVRPTKRADRLETLEVCYGGDDQIEAPAAAAVQVRDQRPVQLSLT